MPFREQNGGQVDVAEVSTSELAEAALREALYPFLSGPIVYFWVFMLCGLMVMVAGRHVWFASRTRRANDVVTATAGEVAELACRRRTRKSAIGLY